MKHLAMTAFALLLVLGAVAWAAEDETGTDAQQLLPAERYFPSASGLTVTYRALLGLPSSQDAEWHQDTFTTRVSPAGDVVFYEQLHPHRLHGPVFARGKLLGVVGLVFESPQDGESAGLAWAVEWGLWNYWDFYILPEKLTALGQQWTCPRRETGDDSWSEPPLIDLTLEAAAIETVEVGGAEYVDCLRVDVAGTAWQSASRAQASMRASGHYWLAPDLGLVRAQWRIEWLGEEDADYWVSLANDSYSRVELVSAHWE